MILGFYQRINLDSEKPEDSAPDVNVKRPKSRVVVLIVTIKIANLSAATLTQIKFDLAKFIDDHSLKYLTACLALARVSLL